MIDWIMENFTLITNVVIVVGVGGVWLWLRYSRDQDRLWADLQQILRDALAFLLDWAHDRLDEVTEADVAKVADWFYEKYVVGTAFERLISREQFRAMLWVAFNRMRGHDVQIRAVMRRL